MGMTPLIIFPIMMYTFLTIRMKTTVTLLDNRNDAQDDLVNTVTQTIDNFALINDYKQYDLFLNKFVSVITDYNRHAREANHMLLTSHYFPKYIGMVVGVVWMLLGGMEVLEGRQTLGMYLALLNIFAKIGNSWGQIYDVLLLICAMFPCLENVIVALNMPTNLEKKREMTLLMIQQTLDSIPSGQILNNNVEMIDKIDIIMKDIPFGYVVVHGSNVERVHVNLKGSLDITMGSLVMVTGSHAGGKSTCLRILGNFCIPKVSDFGSMVEFKIPSFLSILHVSAPLFFQGSLMSNLIFGVMEGSDDGNRKRVDEILQRCHCGPKVTSHVGTDELKDWSQVFSTTECQQLSLARALIANPELLCLHKPFQVFDAGACVSVVSLLREFVDKRGIALPDDTNMRGPRTCVCTRADSRHIELADQIYRVTAQEGIRMISVSEIKDIESAEDQKATQHAALGGH